jgi:hypothetical protein
MVITMALQLSGDLNRQAFVDAVNTSVRNHVLLRSVVVGRGRSLSWRPSSLQPTVDWVDGVASAAPPVPYIDIKKSIGLQIRVEWTPARSVAYFFMHHACCDGISSIRFIAEVLSRYGTKAGDGTNSYPLPAIDQNVLSQRSAVMTSDKVRPKRWDFIREVTNIFIRDAQVLRPSAVRLPGQSGRAIITRTLPRSMVRGLRSEARKLGVTLNDVCTAEFARTLVRWNRQAKSDLAGRFRLMVPLSMRLPKHDLMPAANCISYLPIEFPSVDMSDRAAVVQAVHARTSYALSCNFGLAFLKGMQLARRVSLLLRRFTGEKRKLCTAVLASVGDVRRHVPPGFPQSHGRLLAGNVRVDRVDGVAPIRPNSAIAISFGTYAGEMIFNMRADASVFSDRDADALLDSFVAGLESVCDIETAKVAA